MAAHESGPQRERRRRTTGELLDRLDTCAGDGRAEIEDDLIRANVAVAHDVARRYHGRGVASDDLDQVACMGLVKAVRGYDPAKGTDFLGYAVPTIRGELRRYFRDHGWVVRPPRPVQELQPRVRQVRGTLWQRLGREPSLGEVAAELGVAADQVREAAGADGCFTPASVDASPEEGASLAERLGAGDPAFARVEARETLRPLLLRLTERERRILAMRFRDGRTQAEIGREIGVTQMQVSRLLSGLFTRMRAELVDAA